MAFIKKLNVNQYLHIFEAYEKGYSFQYIINALNIDINPQTLSYKNRDYKAHGIEVLLPNTKRNCYPKELKLNIINECLHSDLSSYDLAIKYGIRSATQVKNWITMYTEGKEISDKFQYSEVYKMKSRKVTYEERVNIVQYYLNHDQSYSEVAHHFNISYGQIYGWVKKYQKHGMDGLIDGRGPGKPRSTMSEKEGKEAEIQALKEQNRLLQIDNEVLKKYHEIEREMIQKASKSCLTKPSKH